MAESKKILSKEIIQDNLFGGLTGSAKEATETVTSLEKALKSLIKVTSKEIKSTPLNSAENIRKVTKDMADQKKTIEAHNEVKKIEIELMAKEAAATPAIRLASATFLSSFAISNAFSLAFSLVSWNFFKFSSLSW